MLEEAGANGPAPSRRPNGSPARVREMQAKLHRWAAADAGRRFDDLFVRHEAPR
jgi:RNA-directed DNA polymerase